MMTDREIAEKYAKPLHTRQLTLRELIIPPPIIASAIAAAIAESKAQQQSDMTCECHPGKPWPHDDCIGPGMPWPACERIIAELDASREADRKEIERLTAIVEKLPRTADGVPVTPDMQLFYVYTNAGRSWIGVSSLITEPKYCYSSFAAAQAALTTPKEAT